MLVLELLKFLLTGDLDRILGVCLLLLLFAAEHLLERRQERAIKLLVRVCRHQTVILVMLVVFVGVRAHAEFRAHLGVDAILILLVKFNNWLEDITRVLVNLVELAIEDDRLFRP